MILAGSQLDPRTWGLWFHLIFWTYMLGWVILVIKVVVEQRQRRLSEPQFATFGHCLGDVFAETFGEAGGRVVEIVYTPMRLVLVVLILIHRMLSAIFGKKKRCPICGERLIITIGPATVEWMNPGRTQGIERREEGRFRYCRHCNEYFGKVD